MAGQDDRHSHRVVTSSAPGAYSTSTGSGAGPKLSPGPPVTVMALRLVRGAPDTVALEAPLNRQDTGESTGHTVHTVSVHLSALFSLKPWLEWSPGHVNGI
jgi:hypothetical protein